MGLGDRAAFPLWAITVSIFLGFMLVSGGISVPSTWMLIAHSAASVALFAVAIWRLMGSGFGSRFGLFGGILAMAALLLVVLQLVPLPPSVWTALPGRGIVSRNLELISVPAGWLPLTLSPEKTMGDALALLPALACFFAAMTIPVRQLVIPFGVMIGAAVISSGLALLQNFHGDSAAYYLYESSRGTGTGTFNNRNFFAAQLYTSLPALSAVAVAISQNRRMRGFIVAVFGLLYAALLVVGLSLSGSRMGIVLTLPAVLFAVALAGTGFLGTSRLKMSLTVLGAILLAFLVMGQASMLGLLRLSSSDPLADYRVVISKQSLVIAREQWVSGSGFGTFPSVYNLHETPATMQSSYVNHVHNDWLEVAIEGGLPAIVLMALFVAWFAFGFFRAWLADRTWTTGLFQRAAGSIILLLLLHSLVDYPLRTPALMALFGFCTGVLVIANALSAQPKAVRTHRKSPARPINEPPKPFVSAKRGFRRPDDEPRQ
jgi:O-antigen ligase